MVPILRFEITSKPKRIIFFPLREPFLTAFSMTRSSKANLSSILFVYSSSTFSEIRAMSSSFLLDDSRESSIMFPRSSFVIPSLFIEYMSSASSICRDGSSAFSTFMLSFSLLIASFTSILNEPVSSTSYALPPSVWERSSMSASKLVTSMLRSPFPPRWDISSFSIRTVA